ncbi:MAG: hypothetical protein ABI433_05640 [Burkholderiaceae bacterium]
MRSLLALVPPLIALALQLLWPLIDPYAWFQSYPAVFASSWILVRFDRALVPGCQRLGELASTSLDAPQALATRALN